jgi:hypothetical protein
MKIPATLKQPRIEPWNRIKIFVERRKKTISPLKTNNAVNAPSELSLSVIKEAGDTMIFSFKPNAIVRHREAVLPLKKVFQGERHEGRTFPMRGDRRQSAQYVSKDSEEMILRIERISEF